MRLAQILEMGCMFLVLTANTHAQEAIHCDNGTLFQHVTGKIFQRISVATHAEGELIATVESVSTHPPTQEVPSGGPQKPVRNLIGEFSLVEFQNQSGQVFFVDAETHGERFEFLYDPGTAIGSLKTDFGFPSNLFRCR